MDTWVAYWHKDGLEIYRIGDKGTVTCASGSLDKLEPLRGAFGRKILIVGRELLLHARKKYPPASKEKLVKAVGLEIGDIFPLSKPAFHCRVFESFPSYTVVDIWAWETDAYSQLREIFPFNYCVPEDVSFMSEAPEVKIFQRGERTSVVALSGDRFIAGASYPASRFEERDVEMFLLGLGQYGEGMKKITIYGSIPLQLKSAALPDVSRVADGKYPPCLDSIAVRKLGEFKVKEYHRLWAKRDLIFRVLIYLVLGYGFMLYLTVNNYDRTMGEMRQRVAAMEKQITKMDDAPVVENFAVVSQEVNGILSRRQSPLKVMDLLARKLPNGSFVKRLVLSENNLEIVLSSREPLNCVKMLGSAPEIKKVVLKGAPMKDPVTGFYSVVISAELSG
jgi:hypothetical protein